MKKSIFFIVFICMFSILISTSAQADSKTEGYLWGGSFGMPGHISTNAGSVEILDANVGFSMDNSLGCGGLDLKGAFKSIIDRLDADAITEQIKDYFTTGLANYLLTQVYSSPALAAIFDSLEAFGNARVSMAQQKCMSYAELRDAGSEVAATRARNQCLEDASGPREEQACFEDRSTEISDRAAVEKQKIENDTNMAGSLYSILGVEEGSTMSKFLPNFKYCAKSGGRCSFDDKTKKDPEISHAEMAKIALDGARHQLFTMNGVMGDVIFRQGMAKMKRLANSFEKGSFYFRSGDNQEFAPIMVAGLDERDYTAPFISDISLNVANLASGPTDAVNQYSAAWEDFGMIMPSSVITEADEDYARFINCVSTDFGLDVANFLDSVELPTNIRMAIIDKGSSPATGEKFNPADPGETYFAMLENIASLSGSARIDAEEELNGPNLLGITVNCIYNHNIHLTPTDYISLVEMGLTKSNAIIASLSEQISFLSVEAVLRYMKHKLLEVSASGVMKVTEVNPDGTPVNETIPISVQSLMAVNMVAESIDNKIATLKAVHKAQLTFSQMMAEVHNVKNRVVTDDFGNEY